MIKHHGTTLLVGGQGHFSQAILGEIKELQTTKRKPHNSNIAAREAQLFQCNPIHSKWCRTRAVLTQSGVCWSPTDAAQLWEHLENSPTSALEVKSCLLFWLPEPQHCLRIPFGGVNNSQNQGASPGCASSSECLGKLLG